MSASDSPSGVRKPSLLRRFVKFVICLAVLLVVLLWYMSDRRMEKDFAERALFYQMRGAALQADGDERPALLDRVLAKYADSGDASIAGDYWDLVYRRAEVSANDEEKAAYLDRVIAWGDSRRDLTDKQKFMVGQAILMRVEQPGPSVARADYLDKAIALAAGVPDTNLYWLEARATLAKVNMMENKAKKIALIDSYLAKSGRHDEPQLQSMTAFLLQAKADAVGERTEKDAVLKEIMDRYGDSASGIVQEPVAWAMLQYAENGETKQQRIGRYKDLIARFDGNEREYIKKIREKAMEATRTFE